MTRFRTALPALAALALVAGSSAAVAAPTPAAAPAATAAITKARLAGADRYKTAVAISKANFTAPQEWVVVASGQAFPDALGAGPMAALLEAPLLLVPATGTLPSSVAAELDRLQTQNIIVVGGPGAVSNSMVSQLAKHAPANQTFTIDGANRYDTAAQTSEGFDPEVTAVPVFVGSGVNFPDALGGGAAASILGGTLLLTTPTKLPAESSAALKRIKPTKVFVLGGTGAVSNTVLTQVKTAVGSAVPVTRLGGTNRFDTAAKVSKAAVTSATEAFLANGLSYPDALAGAAVAPYFGGRPLLLTQKDCVPSQTLAEINRLGITKLTALGGTGVVSDAALGLKPC
jgi:putative cell wall-binding protein